MSASSIWRRGGNCFTDWIVEVAKVWECSNCFVGQRRHILDLERKESAISGVAEKQLNVLMLYQVDIAMNNSRSVKWRRDEAKVATNPIYVLHIP
jgi:hypothetical protein